MPVLRLIFFWVFSLILSFNSLANDQEKFRFSLIDINQGLSNNQVKCFLKDSRGFLWIGTASGLNRYDGYAMKVFKYSSGDTSSITSNDVLKLMEDPQGEIWVRTSQGLCVFDPSTEKFTRNLQSLIKQYRLPANASIEEIVKDKAGNYWFVTLGQGLLKYNPKNRTSVRLQHAISAKNSLSTNHISAMGVTKGGLIWLVHQNGILEKVDPNTLQVLERNDEIYRTYTQQLLDYALTVDSQGDLWVYAREQEGGVFFYETGSRTLHHFHKNSSKLQLSNNLTRGIVEGEKGQIWIGTDHGGINVIDKKNLTVTYIRHNNEQKKSIAHNSINALYKDQEGIIWIGTFKKGVNFYHKNIFRFVTVMQHVPAKGGLPFEDVNAFAEDAQGNLWIGTNGGGLLYWNRTTGAYTRYLYDPKNPKSLSSDVIVSLLIDRQQRLWVGTYLGGLNRFENGTFIRYKNVPGDKTSLSDNSVWELFEDQTGNLWIGTLRGGLALLDPKQKEFVASGVDGGKYPVHCNYISSIAQDRHGNMWVGGGYGLDMFHQKTGKSTFFLHDPKNPRSLVSNNITALYKDRKRNIWIGTAEGLDLYQEEDGTFAHFTTKDGLPSNTIVSIKEDKNGNLWLSTQNGLSNLVITETTKGKTYSFRNYDELDGLQGKAFNENSAYSTRKGEMIFGGPNGFNIFYPDRIEKNTVAPKVVFTDFQLFNKSLQLHQPYNGRELLTRSISETQRLTLEHDENVFSIEFAALNYYHPEKNRYRYQLKGFDTNWQTVDGRNRRVTYTNLDPGEYVFTVLASNNDGVWNETGATLNITVLAPFWRTTTAYVLYFLFAVLALVILRRVELRRAKFKFILEQKEREARQLHELDLMKIKFFTNVSHEFRTPLTLILAPIEELLKAGAHQDLQPQFQMINKNARRLLNMVNQLLDFKKVYDQDISLTLSDGNVVAFVQDAVNSFMELSDKKHVSLHFTSSVREFFTSFDKDKLEKVLFNLLSNAFKFTPENGRIGVSLQCHESDSSSEGIQILEIKVKDTGIGIAKENHQKIFERFFREQVPSYLMNQGSGIGLALANEFVQLHGGLIAVESVPNQG
ncbi:MAG: ligand-binding sensor domain-containing protein, partial [Rufibacter sp.]